MLYEVITELSITQNAFYIQGAIFNRKGAPEIEKAEVIIVSFIGTEPAAPEEITEEDIAGRFDITDSLQKLDEISAVSAYGNDLSDEFDIYEIDVRGKADEGTDYMAKEFVDAIIIVTYSVITSYSIHYTKLYELRAQHGIPQERIRIRNTRTATAKRCTGLCCELQRDYAARCTFL